MALPAEEQPDVFPWVGAHVPEYKVRSPRARDRRMYTTQSLMCSAMYERALTAECISIRQHVSLAAFWCGVQSPSSQMMFTALVVGSSALRTGTASRASTSGSSKVSSQTDSWTRTRYCSA